jgi:hypothetical protein
MIPTINNIANSKIWWSTLTIDEKLSFTETVSDEHEILRAYENYNNDKKIFQYWNTDSITHLMKSSGVFIPVGRSGFFELVCSYHSEQKRKYTGEPYINHLIRACNLYVHYSLDVIMSCESKFDSLLIEVILGHDLFEDTAMDSQELYMELINLQYSLNDASFIVTGINLLSDLYTRESYPYMNRATRKKYEAERLSKIPTRYLIAKLCDSIENCIDIKENDPKFYTTYKDEKLAFLNIINTQDIQPNLLESFYLYRNLLKTTLI